MRNRESEREGGREGQREREMNRKREEQMMRRKGNKRRVKEKKSGGKNVYDVDINGDLYGFLSVCVSLPLAPLLITRCVPPPHILGHAP